jgi:hypothetical protein
MAIPVYRGSRLFCTASISARQLASKHIGALSDTSGVSGRQTQPLVPWRRTVPSKSATVACSTTDAGAALRALRIRASTLPAPLCEERVIADLRGGGSTTQGGSRNHTVSHIARRATREGEVARADVKHNPRLLRNLRSSPGPRAFGIRPR